MRASDSGRDIKLLALDLDGTTLRPDGTLGERTARAIYRAAAAGIEVVPATGRAFSTLPREIREMECIHYAITSNGAAVCRTKFGPPGSFPAGSCTAAPVSKRRPASQTAQSKGRR